MKVFADKVAVVTGAASGIGRALAERCISEGMKVVLADIEEGALNETRETLARTSPDVLSVPTDVARPEDVKNLLNQTLERFEGVHLLLNNAGVAAGAALWESTMNDCQWVLGVNLWGTIHAVRAFVPVMIRQDTRCHIVNTSSIAGMSAFHPSALYHLTKHGIVALSEQLHNDLRIRGLKIDVSVLCPGFVRTHIMDAERNRPEIFKNHSQAIMPGPDAGAGEEEFRALINNGMPAEKVADLTFEGIINETFYIFTHPELSAVIETRNRHILEGRNPVIADL